MFHGMKWTTMYTRALAWRRDTTAVTLNAALLMFTLENRVSTDLNHTPSLPFRLGGSNRNSRPTPSRFDQSRRANGQARLASHWMGWSCSASSCVVCLHTTPRVRVGYWPCPFIAKRHWSIGYFPLCLFYLEDCWLNRLAAKQLTSSRVS